MLPPVVAVSLPPVVAVSLPSVVAVSLPSVVSVILPPVVAVMLPPVVSVMLPPSCLFALLANGIGLSVTLLPVYFCPSPRISFCVAWNDGFSQQILCHMVLAVPPTLKFSPVLE